MKLYAFSDFHLSGDPPSKPMDIFSPAWKNHREKIINAWKETIRPDDVVIMAGDFSWAMHLSDALPDLRAIAALPGRKIMLRGNHDFWWDTVTKMERITEGAFEFLHNKAIDIGPVALAGTRGWIPDTSCKFTPDDAAILKREEGRLERSLQAAQKMKKKEIIAVIHYPPFDEERRPTSLLHLMKQYGAWQCIYGHIHGAKNFRRLPPVLEGIPLHLTSADYLKFKPLLICDLEDIYAEIRREPAPVRIHLRRPSSGRICVSARQRTWHRPSHGGLRAWRRKR